jgi:hypothetical protein
VARTVLQEPLFKSCTQLRVICFTTSASQGVEDSHCSDMAAAPI